MDINKIEYVANSGIKYYTVPVICWMVASDFISEMRETNIKKIIDKIGYQYTDVTEYERYYFSYSKSLNLCNEDIVINMSFITTDIDKTLELVVLKDNPEIPDNEKEMIHYLGETKTIFNNCIENADIYKSIAGEILLMCGIYVASLFNDNIIEKYLKKKKSTRITSDNH